MSDHCDHLFNDYNAKKTERKNCEFEMASADMHVVSKEGQHREAMMELERARSTREADLSNPNNDTLVYIAENHESTAREELHAAVSKSQDAAAAYRIADAAMNDAMYRLQYECPDHSL